MNNDTQEWTVIEQSTHVGHWWFINEIPEISFDNKHEADLVAKAHNAALSSLRAENEKLKADLKAMTEMRDVYAEGFSTQSRLHGEYARKYEKLRADKARLEAALREASPDWKRDLPDESGLWWWWNEDEDCAPIAVNIEWSGGGGIYFATIGQYGWNQPQPVSKMRGWWAKVSEPSIPRKDIRK